MQLTKIRIRNYRLLIDAEFRAFLITLGGEENILTYRQFMEMSN